MRYQLRCLGVKTIYLFYESLALTAMMLLHIDDSMKQHVKKHTVSAGSLRVFDLGTANQQKREIATIIEGSKDYCAIDWTDCRHQNPLA